MQNPVRLVIVTAPREAIAAVICRRQPIRAYWMGDVPLYALVLAIEGKRWKNNAQMYFPPSCKFPAGAPF